MHRFGPARRAVPLFPRLSQGVRQMKMNAPDRETSVNGRVQLSKRRASRSAERASDSRAVHALNRPAVHDGEARHRLL